MGGDSVLILTEGSEEFVVLRFRSNGNSQTVLTELYTVAVPDDDTPIDKVVVDLLGIFF